VFARREHGLGQVRIQEFADRDRREVVGVRTLVHEYVELADRQRALLSERDQ
jgi:hypothetical protein